MLKSREKLPRMQLACLIKRALPQTDRITDMQEHEDTGDVSFKWRGIAFRVTGRLEVTEHFGTHGHGLLLQALLREVHANTTK